MAKAKALSNSLRVILQATSTFIPVGRNLRNPLLKMRFVESLAVNVIAVGVLFLTKVAFEKKMVSKAASASTTLVALMAGL